MGGVQLRPFTAADLPDLLDLWVESWRSTGIPIDFAARRDWFATYLAELHAAGAITMCAFDPAGLAGFATVHVARRCLEQLAVAPSRFGGPVAGALMAAARTMSPGRLELTVNRDNPRAIRFYEREGFVRTGESVSPNSGLRVIAMSWVA